MPRKPTQQQLFAELLERYGQRIADAFMAAIADLTKAADLRRVIAAIQSGDIEAAVVALHLDAAAYAAMLDEIQAAYVASGNAALTYLPAKDTAGVALVVRFDVRNPAAERWLKEHSSTLVTRIVEDQRQAVRTALTTGMVRGDNPSTVALDIVGKTNRVTGQREGGILGLSAPQERYVEAARGELASDDPAALRHYLTRTRRDRRFDRSVEKAIREERALDPEIATKALTKYKSRLVGLRGEMIGRTEAMASLNAAQHQSYLQAVEEGKIAEGDVRRVWRSAHDPRVRLTHAILDGKAAGLREPFATASGARLMFPGDPSAPVAEIAACRCNLTYRIDFLSNIG